MNQKMLATIQKSVYGSSKNVHPYAILTFSQKLNDPLCFNLNNAHTFTCSPIFLQACYILFDIPGNYSLQKISEVMGEMCDALDAYDVTFATKTHKHYTHDQARVTLYLIYEA